MDKVIAQFQDVYIEMNNDVESLSMARELLDMIESKCFGARPEPKRLTEEPEEEPEEKPLKKGRFSNDEENYIIQNINDKTYGEIAEELGRPVGSVSQKIVKLREEGRITDYKHDRGHRPEPSDVTDDSSELMTNTMVKGDSLNYTVRGRWNELDMDTAKAIYDSLPKKSSIQDIYTYSRDYGYLLDGYTEAEYFMFALLEVFGGKISNYKLVKD